jgi:replicative DNA helicase
MEFNNQEAELAVIGTIILDNFKYCKIQGFLKPEHFFFEELSILYAHIETELLTKGYTDKLLLKNFHSNKFEKWDNEKIILNCLAEANSFFDIVVYAQKIIELYQKRKFDAFISILKEDLKVKNFDEIKNSVLTTVYDLENDQQNDPIKINDGIKQVISSQATKELLTTGFNNLDRLTNGLELGSLVIIGGKPSSGKTTFALCLAMQMAEKYSVCFFSVEVKDRAIFRKYLNNKAMITTGKLKTQEFSQVEYEYLQRIAQQENEDQKNLWVDGTKKLTINLIRSKLKKLLLRHKKIDAIFIDYLQLMTPEGKDFSREQQIAKISIGLKQIATEFNIVVFALSQLSRSSDARENKRPMLGDLRDSGSIEASADLVIFVHREHYFLMQQKPQEHNYEKYKKWENIAMQLENKADIIIAKNRDGETGDVRFIFDKQFSKFMEDDYGSY